MRALEPETVLVGSETASTSIKTESTTFSLAPYFRGRPLRTTPTVASQLSRIQSSDPFVSWPGSAIAIRSTLA